jgi:hypothetical protein
LLLPKIDVLWECTRVLNGIWAGLFVVVRIVRYYDVVCLFRKAADTLSNPFSEVQEKRAARGWKAAEAMNAFNKMLDQAEQGK